MLAWISATAGKLFFIFVLSLFIAAVVMFVRWVTEESKKGYQAWERKRTRRKHRRRKTDREGLE